jgi:hypothetical protein
MNEDQWEKVDCIKALDALVDLALFQSVRGKTYLQEFINNVELIKRSQVKQIPALFKKGDNE